jgi:hypothetical protein
MIYFSILSALVAVAYFIQFQAYFHYRDINVGTDLCEFIGFPIENAFEYELTTEEQQLSVL